MQSIQMWIACTILFLWEGNKVKKQWKDHIWAVTLAFANGVSLMSLKACWQAAITKAYWKAAIILAV